MAFLDNSGDIILDAVLTDLGRERMARGDGSFRIEKFALGDDEIDYTLYRNSNNPLGAHPSGSAYYDIEIMQTPVLEAFTNNSSFLKSRLMSVAATDILYLPVMRLAQGDQRREDFYSGSYLVAVDERTQGNGDDTSNAVNMNIDGIFYGVSGFVNDASPITVDQGLDTTAISSRISLNPQLVENQYMIEMDNRFGYIISPSAATVTESFIDDDNIATYYVTLGRSPDGMFDRNFSSDTGIEAAVAGPRGTRLQFKIHASVELSTSTYLFNRLGSTFSLPKLGGGTVSSVKYIDSLVRVSGVTTGYRLDIPVRFIKSP